MTRTAVTDADFYLLEQSLDDEGRQLLRRSGSTWRSQIADANGLRCDCES